VLIDNHVDELSKITNAESRLSKQIVDKESELYATIHAFLQAKGYQIKSKLVMSELIKLVFNSEERAVLTSAQQDLLSVLTELQEINALNEQLIEQSLAFINYSLDVMTGMPDDEPTYQRPEHQGGRGGSKGLFDTRA